MSIIDVIIVAGFFMLLVYPGLDSSLRQDTTESILKILKSLRIIN
jgi:hypothetical protein